jgi:hypothetical protein
MNFSEAHFRTKLTIQGIVYYSVVSEWNHCSRRKFNLTVSVETLIYQRVVILEIIYPNPRDWWGLLDYLMSLAQINNLIILITLWLEINNTGMIIDLTLTQLI